MKKRNIKKRGVVAILAAVWISLVFILCIMPSDNVPDTGISIPHFDKFVHAVMFGGVAFFLYAIFENLNKRKALACAFGIAVIYGGVIELIQPLLYGRGCELADWIADSVGALVAVLLAPWGLVWLNKLLNYLHIKD
ncbi:MAG: VanZ family protein [Marinifilaceae bacterium]